MIKKKIVFLIILSLNFEAMRIIFHEFIKLGIKNIFWPIKKGELVDVLINCPKKSPDG